MDPVAARGLGRSNAVARLGARIALLILLCMASFSAAALEDPLPMVSAPPASGSPEPRAAGQMEIAATSLPRFDDFDGMARSSRLDMVWLPPRRSALGLALGITTMAGPGLSPMERAPGPGLDLGFHWRYTLDRQYRIDVTAWRRMTPSDALDLVQARQSQLRRPGRNAARVDAEKRLRRRSRLPRPATGKRRADHGASQGRQADVLLPHQVLTAAQEIQHPSPRPGRWQSMPRAGSRRWALPSRAFLPRKTRRALRAASGSRPALRGERRRRC